jgi:hypothetical protein
MRDRQLHGTLRAFAEEAAWTLAAQTADGAELPFEIVEERGARGRPALYCYRADTSGFIAERSRDIAQLETWLPAVHALAGRDGLEPYLRSRGHTRIPASGRERSEAALTAFLERLFEDASEFVLSDERFERASGELVDLLAAGRRDVEVVVPLLGVELASPEVPLAEGLALVRPDAMDGVPEEAAWDGDQPNVLVRVTGEDEAVAGQAAVRARRVVTALRLYDAARVAMGPAAWIRTAGGPWQVAATGAGGRPQGLLAIAAEQEDELRAFCNLVWRRMPRGGELAWALARYEMGCERPASQRLTDHLLALRALLEPEGPESGLLADRVAALCADDDGRLAVAERVAHAVSLEHAIVAGHGGSPGGLALADELAGHLRAILRDVLCGHLDSDVRRLADELLSEPVGA